MSALTTAVSNLRERIVNTLRRPYSFITGEWERAAPRKRRLVSGGVGLVVAFLFVMIVWTTFSNIGELEEGNATIREALAAIAQHRDEYLEAKARNAVQEARIGNDPPQLTADLEAAARAENVKIDEQSERPAAPAGKRYIEHDVDLRIREVDLQSLTRFLKHVETGPRLIFFTRMSLKHRYSSDSDKLDAELTATAFEKVKEDKTKKKPEAPGKKE
jgi:type II secretory pathway component PulM